jgi:hypothetical protein
MVARGGTILGGRRSGEGAGSELASTPLQNAAGMVHFFALTGRESGCVFGDMSLKLNGLYWIYCIPYGGIGGMFFFN